MRSNFPLVTAILLAGCGRAMTTTLTGTSPAPTPDAFACVRSQLKALDFRQSSLDTDENRVTARQYDETVRRPDVNFRRLVDRLEIEVAPGADGAVTTLTVNASTFAESTTQRGPTEVQERTSERARTAAEAIVEKCSGGQ
ncbi:MAG: hypothetical protein H0T90_05135 [Gemmatimonadales bacterium]|nr:hypothetical protein [Gemmatimonadales bacterium]